MFSWRIAAAQCMDYSNEVGCSSCRTGSRLRTENNIANCYSEYTWLVFKLLFCQPPLQESSHDQRKSAIRLLFRVSFRSRDGPCSTKMSFTEKKKRHVVSGCPSLTSTTCTRCVLPDGRARFLNYIEGVISNFNYCDCKDSSCCIEVFLCFQF